MLLPCVFFCLTGGPRCYHSNFCPVPYSSLVSNTCMTGTKQCLLFPSVCFMKIAIALGTFSQGWVSHMAVKTHLSQTEKTNVFMSFSILTLKKTGLYVGLETSDCLHSFKSRDSFIYLSFSHFEDKMSCNVR